MKNYSDYGIQIPYGRTSGQVKTFCPKCHDMRHDKSDRSLSVNLDEGVWHCHYCNWTDSLEGKKELSWAKYPAIRKTKPVYRKPSPRPVSHYSEKMLAYFKGRGISEETLRKMKVTEGMEFMPQHQKEMNTVQFNYYKDGELVNTKFRTGDKCFKLVQGAELLPYNLDSIKGKKECLIVEGEIDCLSFVECGIDYCVSVPNGANANLEYLDDYMESHFDDKDTIYIAVDTDSKGTMLREELLRRFGPERCRVVEFSEGCKDANEELMKHGKESLLNCLRMAPETKIDGIYSVSDMEQNLDSLFEKGLQKGVGIGQENLDRYMTFETGRLAVVTGFPSSGKSEVLDHICERLNILHGWKAAFFSPENAPVEYHASKLVEKLVGKRFSSKTMGMEEYTRAKAHMENNFFFIYPNDFRLDTILEKAKALVRRKGIKVLVIDPFNRLENEMGSRSETLYISSLLDKLTNFAQIHKVLIFLMAHPAKPPRNKDGKIDPPTLYDISGSANFYNKADFGFTVHRNREEDYTEVYVQKVKFRHLGENGLAKFKYNVNNGRYVPYYDGMEPMWDNTDHLVEKIREETYPERQEQMISQTPTLEFGYGDDDYYDNEDDNDGLPF